MIYLHLADGFEETEAVTIADVLRRGEVQVKTVSVSGKKQVTGAHDITVEADLIFEEADYDDCDMIVLPGGLPGTYNLRDHKGLVSKIKEFASEGKKLAAICAAPLVLGGLGLLKGKKATIYPGMEENLIGAEAVHEKVVTDGNITTSQGPGTAMGFALHLVEIVKDKAVADEVRAGLLL